MVVTSIAHSEGIHYIVDRVRDRAQTILAQNLHYEQAAIDGFVVALSEVCQNIPEHSEDVGSMATQKYCYGCGLGKNLVKLAVLVRRPDSSWRLLGSLNPYLNEALQFVMQQKEITARDHADDTQVEISLASTKLLNLFKARLVQRSSERVPDGSRQPGALRKGGVQMKAPTIRFSLDVPELLRLQELARQRDQSVSKLLQDLVNQAIAAIPGDGRKVGNTKNDTEQHR